MKYLPFQGISYIPSMIFTNGYSSGEIGMALLQQLIWVHHSHNTDSAFMDSRKKTADYSRRLTGCFMYRCFFNMLVNI